MALPLDVGDRLRHSRIDGEVLGRDGLQPQIRVEPDQVTIDAPIYMNASGWSQPVASDRRRLAALMPFDHLDDRRVITAGRCLGIRSSNPLHSMRPQARVVSLDIGISNQSRCVEPHGSLKPFIHMPKDALGAQAAASGSRHRKSACTTSRARSCGKRPCSGHGMNDGCPSHSNRSCASGRSGAAASGQFSRRPHGDAGVQRQAMLPAWRFLNELLEQQANDRRLVIQAATRRVPRVSASAMSDRASGCPRVGQRLLAVLAMRRIGLDALGSRSSEVALVD